MLIAEHSPIRDISIKWQWLQMKHWVTVHWVRHKWEKFVSTQRTDRTGIPRDKLPQDEPADFTGDANVQQLIDTWRKRLCFQASNETREYAEDFKVTLHEMEPEIADALCPNCVYRGGCSEKYVATKKCDFYDRLCEKISELKTTDLQARYDAYNRWFYSAHQTKSPLILLAGPSGCGKSTVARLLDGGYCLSSVKSFTTRPPRDESDDTHTFITDSEFEAYKSQGNIIAETEINGYSGADDPQPYTTALLNGEIDYLKIGHYDKEKGPLNSPTTNQRFYDFRSGKGEDITWRFQRKEVDSHVSS